MFNVICLIVLVIIGAGLLACWLNSLPPPKGWWNSG